jgi:hypothetical protein
MMATQEPAMDAISSAKLKQAIIVVFQNRVKAHAARCVATPTSYIQKCAMTAMIMPAMAARQNARSKQAGFVQALDYCVKVSVVITNGWSLSIATMAT